MKTLTSFGSAVVLVVVGGVIVAAIDVIAKTVRRTSMKQARANFKEFNKEKQEIDWPD